MNLLVFAYAIYPELQSSEAIVNRSWLNIINKNNRLLVFSATHTYSKIKKNSNENFILKYFQREIRNKGNLFIRIVNFLSIKLTKKSLFYLFFEFIQKRKIVECLNCEIVDVVWLRILPLDALEVLLKCWSLREFPLVVNVNDPICPEALFEHKSFRNDYTNNLFLKSISITQCWTFPSNALADKMSKIYGLERSRCFVLPHAMKKQEVLYAFESRRSEKISVLYAGTFYKSAFSSELMNCLKKISQDSDLSSFEFKFILSQYNEESLSWIKEIFPKCNILKNLSNEEVKLEYLKSDVAMVVDSISHVDLLKGKLMESISFGIPILSVSYPLSVMSKIVSDYGGVVAFQSVEDDIYLKVKTDLLELFRNRTKQNLFTEKRNGFLNRLTEDFYLSQTKQISEFAKQRFQSGVSDIVVSNNWTY